MEPAALVWGWHSKIVKLPAALPRPRLPLTLIGAVARNVNVLPDRRSAPRVAGARDILPR